MLGEKFGHFCLNRLRQQGTRSVAQHLGERVSKRHWLKQLDHGSIGHGVSLLCWRSGGSNTPTIRRLLPVSPSPTSAHSSRTPDGIRAVEKDFRPASAASIERYLASKFGDHLDEVRAAMEQLAASLSPEELNRHGFALYEAFRPAVPAGARGWGAAGELDLDRVISLARGEA